MPKIVLSSQLSVDSKKTVNPKPSTLNRKTKGFTLIELLIVIVIVAILGSIIAMVSLKRPGQARDAVRKADLDKVKKALEFVKADCKASDYYPFTPVNDVSADAKQRYNNAGGLKDYLKDPDLLYLKTTPFDPKNDNTYYYSYLPDVNAIVVNVCADLAGIANTNSGSKDYRLTARLENSTDTDIAKSKTNCPWDSVKFPATKLPDYTSLPVYVVCPE